MSKGGSADGVKVVMVGDANVGKSCLVRRFAKGEFTGEYNRTVGVEFTVKSVFLRRRNTTVNFFLWDTAGQAACSSIAETYYLDAAVAILVFSTDSSESFARIETWRRCVERVCGSIPMILCQTKFDLAQKPALDPQVVERLAVRLQLPLFRVSARDGFNVTQLFEFAAAMCVGDLEDVDCALGTKPVADAGESGVTRATDGGKVSSRKKKSKKKCSVM